ncbi:MAG: hypothetical protein ACKUBY_03615 [Candidatus Moraniibacteriota bacterium]
MKTDEDKIFIKCRACNVLKGCRTDDLITPCRACSEEQFIACRKIVAPLNMNAKNVRTHQCVLCQEKDDILLPIRDIARDDFCVPGASMRLN